MGHVYFPGMTTASGSMSAPILMTLPAHGVALNLVAVAKS